MSDYNDLKDVVFGDDNTDEAPSWKRPSENIYTRAFSGEPDVDTNYGSSSTGSNDTNYGSGSDSSYTSTASNTERTPNAYDDGYAVDPFTDETYEEEFKDGRAEDLIEGPVEDVTFETESNNVGADGAGNSNNFGGAGNDNGRFGSVMDDYSAADIRELAYYFAKGKKEKEPSARMVEMTATGKGFNIPAFLFGIFYLGYRKLYAEAGIGLLLSIAVSTFVNDNSGLLSLIVSCAFGLLFPYLYHKKLESRIEEARVEGRDVRTYLVEKGGVNIAFMVIGLLLLVLFIMIIAAALTMNIAA